MVLLTVLNKYGALEYTNEVLRGQRRKLRQQKQAGIETGTDTLPWKERASSGMGSPWAVKLPRYSAMASLTLLPVSSNVSPCVWHPGRAGTKATYPPSGACSIENGEGERSGSCELHHLYFFMVSRIDCAKDVTHSLCSACSGSMRVARRAGT